MASTRLDIRDNGSTGRFSIYHLTMTDSTIKELLQTAKKNKLKIKFSDEDEGKVLLDSGQEWNLAKPFKSKNNPPKTFVYSHGKSDRFINELGEISKTYYQPACQAEAFSKYGETMIRIDNEKQAGKARELKRPDKIRHAPKYIQQRTSTGNNRTIRPSDGTLVDTTPADPKFLPLTRTTTPPPISASQSASLESRVMHIIALKNGKLKDQQIKEELSRKKLVRGPELTQINRALIERVATLERNKCWFLTEDSLNKIRPDWHGYNQLKEKTIIIKLKEGGFQPFEQKKARPPVDEDLYDSNSRTSETSVTKSRRHSPDTTSHSRRRSPVAAHRPSPPRLSLSPEPEIVQTFCPKSPRVTERGKGVKPQPDRVTIKQERQSWSDRPPSSPKSTSRKARPPTESLAMRYKEAKSRKSQKDNDKREREKDRDRTSRKKRARIASTDEIAENGRKAGLTDNFQEQFKVELNKRYPLISTSDIESRYRTQLDEDYRRFHVIKEQNQGIGHKFEKMKEEMSKCEPGSKKYEINTEKVVSEYRKAVEQGYLKNIREYHETYLRCTHLKNIIKQYHDGLSTALSDQD